MKIINWSSAKFGHLEILVDDEDYENVKQYSWGVLTCMNSDVKYVKARYVSKEKPRKYYSLHRFVLGIDDPKIFVDHRNGNGLDNRKSNLRIATHKENTQNSGPQKNNTSGFKGVSIITSSKGVAYKTPSYQASINIRQPKGKPITYSKCFKHILEAAYRYNELALKYHGEFANLNPVTAIKYADGVMYTHEVKTPCSTPIREKDFIVEQVKTFIPNRA